MELTEEYYAIATNSLDKLAIGGATNRIELHTISPDALLTLDSLSQPHLAMLFQSAVSKIQWFGRFVIGLSENDDEAQLLDTETEKVYRFKNTGGVAWKSGAVDPLGKYFAGTACDGQVYIFAIPTSEEGSQGELVKQIKVTKQNVRPFGENSFEIQWSPDGGQLMVAGEMTLGLIKRDTWEISYSKTIGHKKPITCV